MIKTVLRLAIVSLLLALSNVASAQISYGPVLGVTYSTSVGGFSDVNYQWQYGYKAGAFVNYAVKEHHLIRSELGYTSLEYIFLPVTIQADVFPKVNTITFGYVQLPLTYEYHFESGIHLGAGAFFAYQVSQRSAVDSVYYDPGQSQWLFPRTEAVSHEITANRFQSGLISCVGYLKFGFDLSLNSQYHLTQLFSMEGNNYTNQHLFALALCLAYHIK